MPPSLPPPTTHFMISTRAFKSFLAKTASFVRDNWGIPATTGGGSPFLETLSIWSSTKPNEKKEDKSHVVTLFNRSFRHSRHRVVNGVRKVGTECKAVVLRRAVHAGAGMGILDLARSFSSVGDETANNAFGKIMVRLDPKYPNTIRLHIPLPETLIPIASPTDTSDPLPASTPKPSTTTDPVSTDPDPSPLDPTSLRSSASSSLPPTSPPQSLCMFPTTPTEPITDLITSLREEFPQTIKNATITQGQFTSLPPTSQLAIQDFLRGNFVLWIEGPDKQRRGLVVDRAGVWESYREEKGQLVGLSVKVNTLREVRDEIERGVQRGIKVVRLGALVYVSLQLGAVIVLTQQLGWDLMEPVSYLLSLATTILGATFYCIKKLDYTYENAGDWIRSLFRRRLSKRRKFDESVLEGLEDKMERQKSVVEVWERIVGA